MIFDFIDFQWARCTQLRVVYRGSQILWVVPHAMGSHWLVMSKIPPRPFYAHQGD